MCCGHECDECDGTGGEKCDKCGGEGTYAAYYEHTLARMLILRRIRDRYGTYKPDIVRDYWTGE